MWKTKPFLPVMYCHSWASALACIFSRGCLLPLLADHPGMGRARGDLAPGLRGLPTPDYRDYLIFYRRARGYIDIVRVLHGSQNLPNLFMH